MSRSAPGQGVEWRGVRKRRGGLPLGMAMCRCVLVSVLGLVAVAGYAGEAPEKPADGAKPPADQRQQPARDPVPKDEPAAAAQHSRLSLDDATAIVRQAYGGRVVSAARATARPAPGRPKESGFRVRVDVDGRVKTVFVDAGGRIHENAEY